VALFAQLFSAIMYNMVRFHDVLTVCMFSFLDFWPVLNI
jgi:hypothetical protein